MMVTPTLVSELEMVRERLSAERDRIRSEYESQVAGIDEVLAAVDKILSHQVAQSSETVTVAEDPVAPPDVEAAPTEPLPVPMQELSLVDWKRELAGLEQRQVIIRIAEICGGTIRVVDASRIFLEACETRTQPKHINSQIYRLINETKRFEKVEPGIYRLRIQAAPSSSAEPEVDRSDVSDSLASETSPSS